MKTRLILAGLMMLFLAAALVFAIPHDGSKKSTTGDTKSCCTRDGATTKASLTSKDVTCDPKMAEAKDDECCEDGAKAADHCATDASKASMKKTGTKADCCKDMMKGAKAQSAPASEETSSASSTQ
jgi:hypothetical protein